MKNGDKAVTEVALDNDLAVFNASANATACFEGSAKIVQVVIAADKIVHHRDGFTATSATLHANMEFLLRRRQGFGLLTVILVLVLVVRIGGVDHTDSGAIFFVLRHNLFLFREELATSHLPLVAD